MPGGWSPGSLLDRSIVVTQILAKGASSGSPVKAGAVPAPPFGEGGRILMVGPGSKRRILTAGFQSAADPDVSFDGKRMLFAGKRAASDPWNIFEMDLATQEVRQITSGPGGRRSPIYQGMLYTITAKEPWETITFVAEESGERNERDLHPLTSLHACRLDGSEARRLTFSPSSARDPAVLPDGRIVFSQEQAGSLERRDAGREALFTSQIDGIDDAIFSGDEGQRIKRMPCVTSGGLALFVEAEAAPWDGAGSLASVSLRRSLHSYRRITAEGDGLFHSPSPLPDGTILASRRPAHGTATHAVIRLDAVSGRILDTIFDDPAHHDIQAKLVAPRPQPDGRSSVVSEDQPTGILYGLNVFTSDLEGHGWITEGAPYRLRLLEGIPRRFLGEVEIEADGSFNVEVPANTPIQLQILDEDGMALRTSDWIWARNKEARGCIGCHEDRELAPENRFVSALEKAPIPLTLPPERRRTVDFLRDVMPILARKCASTVCHGEQAPPDLGPGPGALAGRDGLRLQSRAYESLLAPVSGSPRSTGTQGGLYVEPGRARTSPLIWHLFGRDTSRPWDHASGGSPFGGAGDRPRAVPIMPPAGSAPLTDDERRTFVEWIDLGASWSGIANASPQGVPASLAATRELETTR